MIALDSFRPLIPGLILVAIVVACCLLLAGGSLADVVQWWRAHRAAAAVRRLGLKPSTARADADLQQILDRTLAPAPLFDWQHDVDLADTADPVHELAGGTELEAAQWRIDRGGAA